MEKLILSEIWSYPIKSLPGIRLKKCLTKQKGIEGDRRFMLIDSDNQFITLRLLPQLSQFNLELQGEGILVRSRSDGYKEVMITAPSNPQSSITATIWDDLVEVVEVDTAISRWFSNALKMNCKLVYFPEENKRRVDPKYVAEENHVSLADGYPYLIIGRNSLRDLSKRVGAEMVMQRFRPNFVFEGGDPYEEDTWRDFKIGNLNFRGVKPCGRCVLITIDPETGARGVEPLKTLSEYRRINDKVCFGQNVIVKSNGMLYEGDEIKLL